MVSAQAAGGVFTGICVQRVPRKAYTGVSALSDSRGRKIPVNLVPASRAEGRFKGLQVLHFRLLPIRLPVRFAIAVLVCKEL